MPGASEAFDPRSVAALLADRVEARGESVFVRGREQSLTYAEVHERAEGLAAGLHSLGVGPGDRVAIDLPNWPEFVISAMAAARLGAVTVPLNPGHSPRELEFVLRNSRASAVVAPERFGDTDYLQLFESLLFDLPELQYLVTVGEEDLWYDDRIFQFEDLVSSGRGRELPDPGVDPVEDPCTIIYTAGTTGKPKGVSLSHANLLRTSTATAGALGLGSGDVTLCSVPLHHIFGLSAAMLTALASGGELVLQEAFDAEEALRLAAEHGATVLHGVPTMFVMELRAMGLSAAGADGEGEGGEPSGFAAGLDLSALRTGIVAGAPVSEALVRRVREALVPELEVAYGLTETSPTVSITRPGDPPEKRTGTVGRPLEGVEVRVVDEGGRALPDGDVGELAVRGYNVMLGYFRQPDETAACFTADGFFRTGDLGWRDEDGYLHVAGRKSAVIIRGGYNVHPREVEDHLRTHPAVLDAVVVGVPDEVLGERICACVRPLEGAIVEGEELREYCRSALTDHKVPDLVRFMDVFPMTSAGKPRRVEIARSVREEISEAAGEDS